MNSEWTPGEAVAAAAIGVGLLLVFASGVDLSGAWDGDPSFRNRLAMEVANRLVAEFHGGGNPAIAFLQSYHTYPTIVHECLLALFAILVGGLSYVSFDEIVFRAAWFSTGWTLVGTAAIYLLLRLFARRWMALAALPICVCSGYILLYANFPRQNMAAHALAWISLLLYARWRPDAPQLSAPRAAIIGTIWGLSVPTHYSSAYLVFGIGAAEAALTFYQKEPWIRSARRFLPLLLPAFLVWLLLDAYRFAVLWAHPNEVLFNGEPSSGFLFGILFTSYRILTEAAAHKLVDEVWWFLPGLLYRNFGPVALSLLVIGVVVLSRQVCVLKRGRQLNAEDQRVVIIAAMVVASAVVSLGYFQNARKLMVFYPAWCFGLVVGLDWLVNSRWAGRGRSGSAQDSEEGAGGVPRKDTRRKWRNVTRGGWGMVVMAVILGGQWLSFSPAAIQTYEFRRDAGYMKEYLESHGIDSLLVYTKRPESVMAFAANQAVLDSVSLAEADGYRYVMIYRLYQGESAPLMERLRGIQPVVSFKNQNALPIHWYEFPLRSSFCDFGDPLTHSRSLYLWSDVRGAFQ